MLTASSSPPPARYPQPERLVGREHEQAQLHAYLAAARAGQGSLVLIGGEAGIGKTTLVRCLKCDANKLNALVLIGGCYDLTITPPYGPWVEAVRSYRPVDGLPSVPAWFRMGQALESIDSQAALFEEVHEFLAGIAAHRPLVLVLEDLHWSDAASLDLLRFVARSIDTLALLVVATYRIDELTRAHPLFQLLPSVDREAGASRIVLQRFDEPAVRSLVATQYRLPRDDEHRLATYLRAHSEGNPLYLRELLRTLVEEGILVECADRWTLGDLDRIVVPSLIQQLIEGRLDRLGDEARHLLTIAALIGLDVPLDLWSEISGAPESLLEQAIEHAVDAHILQESPYGVGYHFSHALIREVLYTGLVLTRRRQWHRRIGDVLAKLPQPNPAAVAHHFQQAGDRRAAEWQLQAAEQAQALCAPQAAIEHFTRALRSTGSLSVAQQIRALRGRGRSYDTTGDYVSAREDHETALELARNIGDRSAEWQALLDLGLVWASRDYDETGAYWKRALDLARTMDDPAVLARSLNWVGNWHVNVERPFEAQRYHEEALAIYQGTGDRRGVAETHDFLGMAIMLTGNLAKSAGHYHRAVALLDAMGDRQQLSSSLSNLRGTDGQAFNMMAAPGLTIPEGQHAAERALQIARDIGWRSGEAFASSHLGVNLTAQGNYGEALRILQHGLGIAEEIDHRQWVALALWVLGSCYLDLFAYDEARRCLERSFSIAKQIGSLFIARCASGCLALAYIGQGASDAAEELLGDELDQEAEPPTVAQRVQWSAYVELALTRERPEDALGIVDRLNTLSPPRPGRQVPINLMLLRGRALAGLRRWSEAEAALQAARAGATGQGAAAWLYPVQVALVRLYQAQARSTEAKHELLAARTTVEHRAATIPDAMLRERYLRHADIQLAQVATQPAVSLSRREVQVLRLVADGLTDAEVADRLFISPRTVGRHLTAIYIKLGVPSRTAATRVALERRIV